jgi:hypothetical protein
VNLWEGPGRSFGGHGPGGHSECRVAPTGQGARATGPRQHFRATLRWVDSRKAPPPLVPEFDIFYTHNLGGRLGQLVEPDDITWSSPLFLSTPANVAPCEWSDDPFLPSFVQTARGGGFVSFAGLRYGAEWGWGTTGMCLGCVLVYSIRCGVCVCVTFSSNPLVSRYTFSSNPLVSR